MSPKDDKDVFDVSKPGETPAEPSGKPVIVRREGIIKQDPMVKEAQEEEKHKQVEKIEPKREGMSVAPPSQTKPEPSEKPEPEESPAPEPESAAPRDDSDQSNAEINAVATQAKTKKELAKQAEEDQKRAQIRQNLIASKKYFLPIGEAKRRRSLAKLVIAAVLLTLLAAGYMMAFNSGALEDTINFITELF